MLRTPVQGADVEEEGAVDCRPVTRANEFLRQCTVFRDFGLGPDFQACPRGVVFEEEKNFPFFDLLLLSPAFGVGHFKKIDFF